MNRGLDGIGDGYDWARDKNAKLSMVQNGQTVSRYLIYFRPRWLVLGIITEYI